MILLRDGRTLIGYLRSVDQFANLVLHKAIGELAFFFLDFLLQLHFQLPITIQIYFEFLERIHVNDKYGDMERGIFIIRGENVVLLGEIVSSTNPSNLQLPPLNSSNCRIARRRSNSTASSRKSQSKRSSMRSAVKSKRNRRRAR